MIDVNAPGSGIPPPSMLGGEGNGVKQPVKITNSAVDVLERSVVKSPSAAVGVDVLQQLPLVTEKVIKALPPPSKPQTPPKSPPKHRGRPKKHTNKDGSVNKHFAKWMTSNSSNPDASRAVVYQNYQANPHPKDPSYRHQGYTTKRADHDYCLNVVKTIPVLNPLLCLPRQKVGKPPPPSSAAAVIAKPQPRTKPNSVPLQDWWDVFNVWYPRNSNEWWKGLGGFDILGLNSKEFYKKMYRVSTLDKRRPGDKEHDKELMQWATSLPLIKPRPEKILRGNPDDFPMYDGCFVIPKSSASGAAPTSKAPHVEVETASFLVSIYNENPTRGIAAPTRSFRTTVRMNNASNDFVGRVSAEELEGIWKVGGSSKLLPEGELVKIDDDDYDKKDTSAPVSVNTHQNGDSNATNAAAAATPLNFDVLKVVYPPPTPPSDEGESEIVKELLKLSNTLHDLESRTIEPTVRNIVKKSMEEINKTPDEGKVETMSKYKEYIKQQEKDNEFAREREEEEANAHCMICQDGEVTIKNQIVFCEGCNVAVHQYCYGVPRVPEGDWYCRKCEAKEKEAMCQLCPIKIGAFVPVITGGWVHAECAKWHGQNYVEGGEAICKPTTTTPEPTSNGETALNLNATELIEDLTEIKSFFNNKKASCEICGDNFGALVNCSFNKCGAYVHVTCARESKGCDVVHGEDCDGLKEGGWRLKCRKHSRPLVHKNFVPLQPKVLFTKDELAPLRFVDVKARHLELWEKNESTMSKAASKSAAGAFCSVCDLPADNNSTVSFCEDCGVFFHRKCYSGKTIKDTVSPIMEGGAGVPMPSSSDSSRYCDACYFVRTEEAALIPGDSPLCTLCPTKGGALREVMKRSLAKNKKKTKGGESMKAYFGHACCGEYNDRIFYNNELESVEKLDVTNIAKTSQPVDAVRLDFVDPKSRCILCGSDNYCKVKCNQKIKVVVDEAKGVSKKTNCNRMMHVGCARQVGLDLSNSREGGNPDEEVEDGNIGCFEHSTLRRGGLRSKLAMLVALEGGKGANGADDEAKSSKAFHTACRIVNILSWGWRWGLWWASHGYGFHDDQLEWSDEELWEMDSLLKEAWGAARVEEEESESEGESEGEDEEEEDGEFSEEEVSEDEEEDKDYEYYDDEVEVEESVVAFVKCSKNQAETVGKKEKQMAVNWLTECMVVKKRQRRKGMREELEKLQERLDLLEDSDSNNLKRKDETRVIKKDVRLRKKKPRAQRKAERQEARKKRQETRKKEKAKRLEEEKKNGKKMGTRGGWVKKVMSDYITPNVGNCGFVTNGGMEGKQGVPPEATKPGIILFRAQTLRKCKLVSFAAALRNREYDRESGLDKGPLSFAFRDILKCRPLCGNLDPGQLSFAVTWLCRAYRSKQDKLMGIGEFKTDVDESTCRSRKGDDKMMHLLGGRALPGEEEWNIFGGEKKTYRGLEFKSGDRVSHYKHGNCEVTRGVKTGWIEIKTATNKRFNARPYDCFHLELATEEEEPLIVADYDDFDYLWPSGGGIYGTQAINDDWEKQEQQFVKDKNLERNVGKTELFPYDVYGLWIDDGVATIPKKRKDGGRKFPKVKKQKKKVKGKDEKQEKDKEKEKKGKKRARGERGDSSKSPGVRKRATVGRYEAGSGGTQLTGGR